ncbi:MAG: M20/M25/M40 family metallo-hydrolase [Chloroflexi bacterium]|nr:M20/M25/M40 family metallo-hydrolase [Chloroflexota bacterium]
MPVTREEVTQLISELVKIDSSNPWLVPGSPGENEVADYIARWLAPLGVKVWQDEVEDGRKNLIAMLPGSGGGKSLVLNAHMDTVGYESWKIEALVPRIEGDYLYGLGSSDDKGHCAAAMLTLKALVQSGEHLKGDVWLGLVIDEEGTSSGSMDFCRRYHPDGAIVMEASGLNNVCVTHQGFGWLDVIVYGRPAHGCAPEVGIDAIHHMGEVVTRLHQLDAAKYAPTAHPLNGKTVFHTGTIHGGTDYATYPGKCVLGIEIGTQPGETIKNRVVEIEDIFHQVKVIYHDFHGEVKITLDRNPFETKGSEALWEALSAEVLRVTGQPARRVGENSWGDAALFQEAGIPTLELGAAGANFHAPQEWVSLPDVVKLVEILEVTIRRFCN